MKNKKSSHISEFKEGEILTRIEPFCEIFPGFDDLLEMPIGKKIPFDINLIGEKLKYLGIGNSQIYVEFQEGTYKNEVGALDYYSYQNGWAKSKFEMLDRKSIEDIFSKNFNLN